MSPDIALLMVDVQRDFLEIGDGIGSTEKTFCLPGAQNLLGFARDSGWRIIHAGTCHSSEETMPPHLRRRGRPVFCKKGTAGAEFSLSVQPGEEKVFKTDYSAFRHTDLESLLDGVSRIVIAGTAVDCCVFLTIFDAAALGPECYVPIQAVSASSCEAFTAGLVAISKSAADVIDLDVLLAQRTLDPAIIPHEDVHQRAEDWFCEMKESATAPIT